MRPLSSLGGLLTCCAFPVRCGHSWGCLAADHHHLVGVMAFGFVSAALFDFAIHTHRDGLSFPRPAGCTHVGRDLSSAPNRAGVKSDLRHSRRCSCRAEPNSDTGFLMMCGRVATAAQRSANSFIVADAGVTVNAPRCVTCGHLLSARRHVPLRYRKPADAH